MVTMMALTRANGECLGFMCVILKEILYDVILRALKSYRYVTLSSCLSSKDISSISDVTGSSFGPVPCPQNWTEYNDHCFQYVARNLSWAKAQVIIMD